MDCHMESVSRSKKATANKTRNSKTLYCSRRATHGTCASHHPGPANSSSPALPFVWESLQSSEGGVARRGRRGRGGEGRRKGEKSGACGEFESDGWCGCVSKGGQVQGRSRRCARLACGLSDHMVRLSCRSVCLVRVKWRLVVHMLCLFV